MHINKIYVFNIFSGHIIQMMQFFLLITLITTIICAESAQNSLVQYRDPLFQKHRIEGIWHQTEVKKTLGSCQPCFYMIQIYSWGLKFRINNPSTGVVLDYETKEPQSDFFVLFIRQYTMTAQTDDMELKIQIQPQDGMKYQYTVILKEYGVYITHTQNYYEYLVPILSILYCTIILLLFPFSKQEIAKNVKQTLNRINSFSIFCYSFTIAIILAYHLALVIFYLWHWDGAIGKIAFYSIFGSAFMTSMILFGYSFAIIQMKVNQKIKQNNLCKLAILFIMAIYLIANPILAALFVKSIWFHMVSCLGLAFQIFLSASEGKYPSWRFMIMNAVSIFYLALLSNYYPIFNFHELSKFNFICLFLQLVIILGGGYLFLRKSIGVQRIQQITEINKQSTTNQIVISNKFGETMEQIKSDIQLQSHH